MAIPENMVRNLTKKMKEKGFEILYAKCDDYPNPTEIRGVEPDVVGWDPEKELYHLGIVTNSATLNLESTDKKMIILADNMMGVGKSEGERLPLYLGFPKESANEVNTKLREIEPKTTENIIKLEV